MILTLDEAKEFLRLEQDCLEEDNLLILIINNAEAYIENAIGREIDITNEKMVNQTKLIALTLVVDFYENRELTVKASEKTRNIITGMITQLKYCYEGDAI